MFSDQRTALTSFPACLACDVVLERTLHQYNPGFDWIQIDWNDVRAATPVPWRGGLTPGRSVLEVRRSPVSQHRGGPDVLLNSSGPGRVLNPSPEGTLHRGVGGMQGF